MLHAAVLQLAGDQEGPRRSQATEPCRLVPSLVAIAVGKFVVAAIVRILKKDQDDRIGVLYRTLVRQRHYPFGQCKYDNEWDLTVNMRVDYETFAYE